VILAFSRAPDRALVDHLRHCEAAGLGFSVVPRFFESMVERVELQRIGALPLMALRSVDPKGWQFGVKYGLDRMVAATLIVLLAPLLLLVAAAVRLTSRGPALFRQRRVGLDSQVFDLLKFRSMRVCEDEPGFELRAGLAPGGVEGEDRRTAVGRFIRRAFIDELPQLFNVVRGEMSLIGPRPERPEFVAEFAGRVKRYGDRHRVRSGITGWAQVNGLRGQTSLADRIELDNYYIESWSVALDLKSCSSRWPPCSPRTERIERQSGLVAQGRSVERRNGHPWTIGCARRAMRGWGGCAASPSGTGSRSGTCSGATPPSGSEGSGKACGSPARRRRAARCRSCASLRR
jgi:lipopolysaccharide/colanic/teichoic acid biosynthesis glycosyltransferase